MDEGSNSRSLHNEKERRKIEMSVEREKQKEVLERFVADYSELGKTDEIIAGALKIAHCILDNGSLADLSRQDGMKLSFTKLSTRLSLSEDDLEFINDFRRKYLYNRPDGVKKVATLTFYMFCRFRLLRITGLKELVSLSEDRTVKKGSKPNDSPDTGVRVFKNINSKDLHSFFERSEKEIMELVFRIFPKYKIENFNERQLKFISHGLVLIIFNWFREREEEIAIPNNCEERSKLYIRIFDDDIENRRKIIRMLDFQSQRE